MPWWAWLVGLLLVDRSVASAPVHPALAAPAGGPDPHGFNAANPPAVPSLWQCDRDLPNAGDCGNPGENGDAHLARYLHARWGVALPPGIESFSCQQLTSWLSSTMPHLQPDALADLNAMMYGCLAQKIGAEVTRAWHTAQTTATDLAQGTYYLHNPFGSGGLSL